MKRTALLAACVFMPLSALVAQAYSKGIPLGTQAQWGWHSFPNPEDGKWNVRWEGLQPLP